MSARKIKTGDQVRIIAGKDIGKEGKVLHVNTKDNTVIVEGANMITKHQKPSAANANGGIVNREAPIHISNVMYLHKGQPTRIGFKVVDGKKVRYAKKTGDTVD